MKELLKKTFEYSINNVSIEFKQLTLKECIERDYNMKSKKISVGDWAYAFLANRGFTELTDEQLYNFYEFYCDNALKGFYNKSNSGNNRPNSIPSAGIVWICSELKIDPISLLDNYTPEALDYLTDGVIRNKNSETPKGRQENSRKLQIQELNDGDNEKDLKEIEEFRKKKLLLSKNGQGA